MFLLHKTRKLLAYKEVICRYVSGFQPFTHPTDISCLETRMKVATEETGSPITTVGVFFEGGPRYESPESNGFSYYFEHMAYKTTESLSYCQFESHAEFSGVKFKVDTRRDHVVMYVTCLNEHTVDVINCFGNAFDLLLSECELFQERQQIPNNLCEKELNNKKITFDYLYQTAYQGTQFAQTIEGPSKNIRLLNNKNIREFLIERLQPWRMTIASSGGVNHNTLMDSVNNSRFSSFVGNPCVRPECPPQRFTGSSIMYRNDDLPFAHVAVAFEAPGVTSPDYVPMLVARSVISSWHCSQGGGIIHASPIAQAMSKSGDCESYDSFYIPYADTGLWGVYIVANGKHLDDVMCFVQQQWVKLCTCLTENEFNRAKELTKTRLAKKFSNQVSSCMDLGYQVLFTSCRWNYIDFFTTIKEMKLKDVCESAHKYLYNKCPAVSAIGPIETMPDYNRIKAGMYWLRL